MTKSIHLSVAALTAALFVPARSTAQVDVPVVDEGAPTRVWIVWQAGVARGGPASGLAEQMIRAGFDVTEPGTACSFLCFSGSSSNAVEYPRQVPAGVSVAWAARLAISGRLVLGGGYALTELGGADGYRADDARIVSRDWQASKLWVTAFWRPVPGLRVGGGPGWYRLMSEMEDVRTSRVGLMAEGGAELPLGETLFLDLAARYHLVPAREVEHDLFGRFTVRPNWSHATFLAGVGIRF